MAEKGKTWSERERKLLLELWSKDRIQHQLQGAVCIDNVFRTIAKDLRDVGSSGWWCHVGAKMKVLKRSTRPSQKG